MSKSRSEESDTGLSKDSPQNSYSRRQFLGLLGASTVASVGLSEIADAQESPVISVRNNYFDPIGLYVEPGTTVRFEIEAGSHSATAYVGRIPSGADPFDSGVISDGGFDYTFDEPGTYDYYCIPHQSMGMVGRIVVGEPGGPAEESPIPDGDAPESQVIVEQGTVPIERGGGDGETMGSGSGMMHGGGRRWMMLVPIGFVTTALGVVGGIAYWFSRRGDSGT